MSRNCLYYIREPKQVSWLLGDRYVRLVIRRVFRGAPRLGCVDKVFINLCLEKCARRYVDILDEVQESTS
ncbi:MAG: hypothetical protein PUP92_25110 [Rhizonema sp. PD38]|nr:hypothetical protein [Rhizonema sp. PD38]